jgi:hypothetical protein
MGVEPFRVESRTCKFRNSIRPPQPRTTLRYRPEAPEPSSEMIPRILWHMGSGILRRKLSPPVPGALLRWPGVWKSRASLRDCNFSDKLVENAYFRNMELAIWYGCGYVHRR